LKTFLNPYLLQYSTCLPQTARQVKKIQGFAAINASKPQKPARAILAIAF
jgi:hypothetical protein